MTSKSVDNWLYSSVPEGYMAALSADIFRGGSGDIVLLAKNMAEIARLESDLKFYAPDLSYVVFPEWDCLPYDRASPRAEVQANRIATLYKLAKRDEGKYLILTTAGALTQKVLGHAMVTERAIDLRASQTYSIEKLTKQLVDLGYVSVPNVAEAGEFSVRGGLLDLFAPGQSLPIRLDFFGDVLETMKTFDPLSQRSKEPISNVTILPASEVLITSDTIERFRSKYRRAFGNTGKDDPLYEAVSAGRIHQGMEHWLPFFEPELRLFFDFLTEPTLILPETWQENLDRRLDIIKNQYQARQDAGERKGGLESLYQPIDPDLLYLNQVTFADILSQTKHVVLQTTPAPISDHTSDLGFKKSRNFSTERQAQQGELFPAVIDHLRVKRATKPVVIASFSEGARERLSNMLSDYGIEDAQPLGTRDPRKLEMGQIALAVWALEEGFENDALLVLSEQDILGQRLLRQRKSRKRAENFLTEATSLKQGDLVVHVEHGIGRFLGLETVTALGAPHDCLQLEYANSDRLYLPIENIDLLARYGQETGVLDKLGGSGWQARKARLKERLKDMAEKLIRIAAERELRRAEKIEPPSDNWDDFCAKFPYTETDDQLNAIDDVLGDLASGRPMDRLVCGDVGFGKTEVALRGAFAAADSGLQVAIIAPTTLLARQHFNSFSERFKNTPIRVRQLSRFVSASDAKATKEAMKDGQVDIVIGTHALLSKDVRFANLGLLVIDEEQKFGVAHKERLKQLRSDIHVLTLTATPIPRTLQMSLAGVRDLSLIATAPVDRLAIKTYVSEFDRVTIREALLREFYRGGQSFFVVPRISDLAEIEEFLTEDMPELKFTTAHGQMAAGDLDQKMNDFYDGKYHVLLATTIVESGLDVPTANTMIIHHADRFGLAQLYQIRGRVGRSKTRAYAYLTTKPKKPLTPSARKRLRVLSSLDNLGAGFTLASQDLDLRGAGNLLGEEQSGNIREVGYELYQSMLEDAIAKLKAGDKVLADDGKWAPQINLGVPVLIPTDYVPDLDLRLGLYRRLSNLGKRIELDDFAAEMIDRFGPLPSEVEWLLRIVRIKALCQRANISKLDGGPKGAVIQFHNDRFSDPDRLAQYLMASNGTAKVKENKLVVRRDWTGDKARVNGAYIIVRDLLTKPKSS